jgi:hypothetical protein
MLVVHNVYPNNEWSISTIASMQPDDSLGPSRLHLAQRENVASSALALMQSLVLEVCRESNKRVSDVSEVVDKFCATNDVTNELIRCYPLFISSVCCYTKYLYRLMDISSIPHATSFSSIPED